MTGILGRKFRWLCAQQLQHGAMHNHMWCSMRGPALAASGGWFHLSALPLSGLVVRGSFPLLKLISSCGEVGSVTPTARVNEKEVLSVISACLCQANSSGVPEPLDFPSRNPCPRPRHLTLVRLISGPGLFSVAAVQPVCCGMFRESLFSTHEMPFACQPQLSQPNISRHSQMSPKEENNPLQIAF